MTDESNKRSTEGSFGRSNGYRLTVLLTDNELSALEKYCNREQVTKAEAIRRALKLMYKEK